MGKMAACLAVLALVVGGCATSSRDDDVLRIYTSVTQDTVDAVVAGFETDVELEVFRAPTGDIAGRIAAEERLDGLRADVLWLTDPLSIQQYAADGLLESWTPAAVEFVAPELVEDTFVGTRILAMVLVQQPGVALETWEDFAQIDGSVAIPDPGFAGSAFGAVGYFSQDPAFGYAFYEELAAGNAVEVSSPGDVVTGVAEGRYVAGMTLDAIARSALQRGSPIEIVFPAPGAIAIYSPIAVVKGGDVTESMAFVEHVLSIAGQTAIADTGWRPVRDDVAWEEATGPLVFPNWTTLFDRQDEILDEYRSVFEP